jgi:hypothetical protein
MGSKNPLTASSTDVVMESSDTVVTSMAQYRRNGGCAGKMCGL